MPEAFLVPYSAALLVYVVICILATLHITNAMHISQQDSLINEYDSCLKRVEEDRHMLAWEVRELTKQITFAENALRYKEREMEKYKRRDILLRARSENRISDSDELVLREYLLSTHGGNALRNRIYSSAECREFFGDKPANDNWTTYLAREKAIQGGLK